MYSIQPCKTVFVNFSMTIKRKEMKKSSQIPTETLPLNMKNVWVEDSVFTHVEKELREMENISKPNLNKSLKFSEELINFIEMELKEFDNNVLHEGIGIETGILKTPDNKGSVTRRYQRRTKVSGRSCGSNWDGPTDVGHSYSSLGASGGGDVASEDTDKSNGDSDGVLCLKHLDQSPLNSVSFMRQSNRKRKAPLSSSHLSSRSRERVDGTVLSPAAGGGEGGGSVVSGSSVKRKLFSTGSSITSMRGKLSRHVVAQKREKNEGKIRHKKTTKNTHLDFGSTSVEIKNEWVKISKKKKKLEWEHNGDEYTELILAAPKLKNGGSSKTGKKKHPNNLPVFNEIIKISKNFSPKQSNSPQMPFRFTLMPEGSPVKCPQQECLKTPPAVKLPSFQQVFSHEEPERSQLHSKYDQFLKVPRLEATNKGSRRGRSLGLGHVESEPQCCLFPSNPSNHAIPAKTERRNPTSQSYTLTTSLSNSSILSSSNSATASLSSASTTRPSPTSQCVSPAGETPNSLNERRLSKTSQGVGGGTPDRQNEPSPFRKTALHFDKPHRKNSPITTTAVKCSDAKLQDDHNEYVLVREDFRPIAQDVFMSGKVEDGSALCGRPAADIGDVGDEDIEFLKSVEAKQTSKNSRTCQRLDKENLVENNKVNFSPTNSRHGEQIQGVKNWPCGRNQGIGGWQDGQNQCMGGWYDGQNRGIGGWYGGQNRGMDGWPGEQNQCMAGQQNQGIMSWQGGQNQGAGGWQGGQNQGTGGWQVGQNQGAGGWQVGQNQLIGDWQFGQNQGVGGWQFGQDQGMSGWQSGQNQGTGGEWQGGGWGQRPEEHHSRRESPEMIQIKVHTTGDSGTPRSELLPRVDSTAIGQGESSVQILHCDWDRVKDVSVCGEITRNKKYPTMQTNMIIPSSMTENSLKRLPFAENSGLSQHSGVSQSVEFPSNILCQISNSDSKPKSVLKPHTNSEDTRRGTTDIVSSTGNHDQRLSFMEAGTSVSQPGKKCVEVAKDDPSNAVAAAYIKRRDLECLKLSEESIMPAQAKPKEWKYKNSRFHPYKLPDKYQRNAKENENQNLKYSPPCGRNMKGLEGCSSLSRNIVLNVSDPPMRKEVPCEEDKGPDSREVRFGGNVAGGRNPRWLVGEETRGTSPLLNTKAIIMETKNANFKSEVDDARMEENVRFCSEKDKILNVFDEFSSVTADSMPNLSTTKNTSNTSKEINVLEKGENSFKKGILDISEISTPENDHQLDDSEFSHNSVGIFCTSTPEYSKFIFCKDKFGTSCNESDSKPTHKGDPMCTFDESCVASGPSLAGIGALPGGPESSLPDHPASLEGNNMNQALDIQACGHQFLGKPNTCLAKMCAPAEMFGLEPVTVQGQNCTWGDRRATPRAASVSVQDNNLGGSDDIFPPHDYGSLQNCSASSSLGVNIQTKTYVWAIEQVSISVPSKPENMKLCNLSRPLKKRKTMPCYRENIASVTDGGLANSPPIELDILPVTSEAGACLTSCNNNDLENKSRSSMVALCGTGQVEQMSNRPQNPCNGFPNTSAGHVTDTTTLGNKVLTTGGDSCGSMDNLRTCLLHPKHTFPPNIDSKYSGELNMSRTEASRCSCPAYRRDREQPRPATEAPKLLTLFDGLEEAETEDKDSVFSWHDNTERNNNWNHTHPQLTDISHSSSKSDISVITEPSKLLCLTNDRHSQEDLREESFLASPESQGRKMTHSTTTLNEDILHLALKADLFDVITCENESMYSWPAIEDLTLPVSLSKQQPSSQDSPRSDVTLGMLPDNSALARQKQDSSLPHHHGDLVDDIACAVIGDVYMERGKMEHGKSDGDSSSVLAPLVVSGDNLEDTEEEGEFHDHDLLEAGVTDNTEEQDENGSQCSAGVLCAWTHADQLPFRCEFCGRLFKHKRSRDRHVKLHTGDKKYKCCHCEAAFSRSDHLKIHKKTHDTQKPYQCTVCNRGYNTAAALTAHMQNHKAKLTAHTLNQLLKDAQAPGEAHALTHLLREPAGDTHSQSFNNYLKDSQKEQQLLSPRVGDLGSGSSPGEMTASPVGEPSPSLSPAATLRCPACHAHCRNHAHLQRHVARHHGEEMHERPASRSGGSGTSSVCGASSVASTPSPRPPSSLPSPRPLSNPLLSLVGGKLACLYCSRDGFPSLEALQLHLQSSHGSVLNGEVRDMASMLGLPPSLGTSLSASGLQASLASSLGAGSSRGVSCELCGARVQGVSALQRHVVTAHTFTDLLARAAEGVFCAQCLLPFSNPGALAEHIKLVHASPVLSAVLNKRPPSPPTDTPTDLSKKSRHDSLTSDLPASTLLCSQCNAPFTNFEAFRRHLKSHLDGAELTNTGSTSTQLVCPECRLPLTSEASLETHLASHLGVTSTEYGCQACLKLFSKPDELQKHLMDIHAHHLYRCALCKEMFDSKVSIQVHFAVKHSNECKVHKCTRCSLIFRSQSEFEGHIRGSHMRRGQGGSDGVAGGGVGGPGGSYRCLLCTLSLTSEAELAAHVATHQRQFQCSLCDDAFHVEFLLDKHMQTQHNSELNGNIPQPENLAKPRRSPLKKDFRCDICDAEFSSDSALVNHRKQAHNIKSGAIGITAKVAAASLSLFCAYCSEAFKSRGDLEAHMKSHQGNGGRHKCNICDELCPSAALLAQHKLTHVKVVSGSACAVCREPLTSEQQFTSHQNDHHPAPLPQPCVVCRQTLVTDMEVNVHARFHAAQAAQAAAAASIASGTYSSGDLLPPSTSSIMTTAATASTITTNSSNNGRSSISPRLSPSLRCSECHLKLETLEEAEAHAAIHHHQQQNLGRCLASSSRTYQCIKCQESFASEAEIEAHVASHLFHEGSVHECHLCRATFDTPLRLQCHLIEHTFEGCGSFTCYMCSSVYTTASRLQQHMVEHGLSARPYDCHHCHQRFFFRAELENHALSHPEAAEGGCRECVASFPDLPRRTVRRQSLSCIAASQLMGPQCKSDTRLPRPVSPLIPRSEGELDVGPTNGHATSAAESLDE